MSYLNSVTIIGFVGANPEQRQLPNNGAKFTVLSVASRRSWKSAKDEWSSKTEWHRIAIFRPRLAQYVLTAIKKGEPVLVGGCLVSSTANRPIDQSKKARVAPWSIRAHVVRIVNRTTENRVRGTAAPADKVAV